MITKQQLIIVGAGGHAKVVLSVAVANSIKIRGYLDDNNDIHGNIISGHPVISGTPDILSHQGLAVFGLGNNSLRKKIAETYTEFSSWETLVHPTAYVHPSVQLGKGTVVFAGAVIQPDVIIGDHCIINTGATVDHDCIIGDYVHLAPGVHLAGGVQIGEGAFLGIGSVVIPSILIGDWAQVAAGGVVVNPIGSNKTVMGVPAREHV